MVITYRSTYSWTGSASMLLLSESDIEADMKISVSDNVN